mmetsp:Transcript_20883/g.45296  ORF Transcript_20883/g.45296 Transcript_20883/m.45296 type:complete len:84 (-) Transcript_20883:1190-1441(-)
MLQIQTKAPTVAPSLKNSTTLRETTKEPKITPSTPINGMAHALANETTRDGAYHHHVVVRKLLMDMDMEFSSSSTRDSEAMIP